MKTLLFFPKLEPHKDFHYMPISALAVASELLAQGHEVTIWDNRVYHDLTLYKTVENIDQIMISAYTGYQLSQAYRFAKDTKEFFPDKKIILGGPHATALPEQTLASPYVDEVVQGDIDTGARQLPYWLIDHKKYINPETERFIYISSYGCPGICTFCATKNRRKYLPLPLERVETDIDYLMAQYPYKEAVFFDATLFTMPKRVGFIAGLMDKHNLRWIADARAPEIAYKGNGFLSLCTESGLQQLTIGLESGSPRIIDMMKKGKNHLEHYLQATEKLKQFPIKQVSGVVFGCPGETVDDLRQTIDYIKRIKEINSNFFISTTFYKALPDTLMSDMAAKYGYKQPDSLEAWAELGAENHYSYNEFENVPWLLESDKYRAIYEDFKRENADLFV